MKPEQQEIERLRRELARIKAEFDILKKAVVGSTGHCNGFRKRSSKCPEAKGFSWPRIELESNSVEIGLGIARQVRTLRQILSQQAIRVFVATTLRTPPASPALGHHGDKRENVFWSSGLPIFFAWPCL